MNADEIFIHNLVVQTIIGVLPLERINQQPIELDIALKMDAAVAAQSENLADTLDYAAIAGGLSAYIQSTQFLLIETLAESIVSWLWNFSPMINHVTLELRKPMAVLQAKTVGLKITRTR
jgi:dihydroneopterin aldolase